MTITATDDLSGIVGYTYSKNSEKPSEYTTIENTKNFNITIEDLNINTKYYIWIKDATGNEISGEVTTKDAQIVKRNSRRYGNYVNDIFIWKTRNFRI